MEKSSSVNNLSTSKPPQEKWGSRYNYVILVSFGTMTMLTLRVNLSVGLVAMVNTTSLYSNITASNQCPLPDDTMNDQDENDNGEFNWDEKTQGFILGAFYYGFCMTQIPGGFLAEKYGGKMVFGGGILMSALLSLTYPTAARTSSDLFIVLRALQGFFEGVTMPALYVMNSKWLPESEKAFLSTITFCGMVLGTIISYPVCGVLAEELHWEYVFYVPAGTALLWCVLWFCFASACPRDCKRISLAELKYIEAETSDGKNQSKKLPNPPLRHILTSKPFFALVMAQMGNFWAYYTLMTGSSKYLSAIQHFSLEENGLFSALPYICGLLVAYPVGKLSDYLITTGKLSKLNSRKLFSAIGNYGPALGLVGLAFVGCDRVLAIVLLCASVGSDAAGYSGYMINFADLSPNYIGTLCGISNTLANITGFVSPIVTGLLTNGNQTISAWRTVFLISACILTTTTTIYMFWASADVQIWNNPDDLVQEEESETDCKKDGDPQIV